MKLVTYLLKADSGKKQYVGALTKDESQVVDLQKAAQKITGKASRWFESMIDFLTGAGDARALAAELLEKADSSCKVAMEDVQLLAPVPRPLTLRDCACHEAHVTNGQRRILMTKGIDPNTVDPETLKPTKDWYFMPLFYKGNVNSVIGTGVDVAYPEGETFKDYELELAFYICKEGRNISHRDAMDYVGGYTVFNDCSSRMVQLKEMNPALNVGPARGKDFANPMGPCMVTPDAFDYEHAQMTVRVNGQVRGGGNHGECYHKIPEIIEYISSNTTLYPGDAIATGTVGTGSGFEVGMPLRIDDVVEMEIEGIGKLVNKVIAPPAGKRKNLFKANQRFVCGQIDGKSAFVIDDYPDVWNTQGGEGKPCLDVWRVNEMPAKGSATAAVDMGNLPVEHEPKAGSGSSIFRHASASFPLDGPRFADLPEAQRKAMMVAMLEMHKIIGTKNIPTEEDLKKHMTMHRTETLNMFFLSAGEMISLNDLEDAPLKPGDVLIQLAGMHGWKGSGTASGLLVSADMSTFRQLTEKPKPVLTSKLNRFRRYVTGTMKSEEKEDGMTDNLIVDFSPNECEIYDKTGKLIGYAGEMWKTFGPNADVSGASDTITGPMEANPPKSGITFRMIDLLPSCTLETNESCLNYYCSVTGEVDAISDSKRVTVPITGNVIQLKDARMQLENTSTQVVRIAHYMIDAE